MNLLSGDVNEFVDFLIEHDLTADQFLYCALLSSEVEDAKYNLPSKKDAISSFYEYYNNVVNQKEANTWKQSILDDLVDKGYLVNKNNEGEYQYDRFEVTNKFIDLVFEECDSQMEKFNEFWHEYPSFYETSDGQKLNIKAVNKEMLFSTYKKALSEVEHEIIIKCLKIAKAKDEVNCRIDKWLNSHRWEPYLKQAKESDEIEENQDVQQTVL